MKLLTLLIAAAMCGQAQYCPEKAVHKTDSGNLYDCVNGEWKLRGSMRLVDDSPSTQISAGEWKSSNGCITGVDKNGVVIIAACQPSIESRVERLEKAVEKLPVPASSAYLPSSLIAVYDPVERRMRVLTLAEANALLVALAKAVNAAAEKSAVEGVK